MLAPWPAFLAAVGIGTSSAGAFVTVGFAVYVLFSLLLLNYYFKAKIPRKGKMAASDKAQQDFKDKELEMMRAVVEALKNDVQRGSVVSELVNAFSLTCLTACHVI